MKSIVLLSTLGVCLILATGASFAQAVDTGRVPPGATTNIYQSFSLRHQAYPNPDRDYLGENRYPARPIR
jgi:hypothetical protein